LCRFFEFGIAGTVVYPVDYQAKQLVDLEIKVNVTEHRSVATPDSFTVSLIYETLTITLNMKDFTMIDEGYGVFDNIDLPIILSKSEETSPTVSANDFSVVAWRIGSTLFGTHFST
jgi:hypothetical protein